MLTKLLESKNAKGPSEHTILTLKKFTLSGYVITQKGADEQGRID